MFSSVWGFEWAGGLAYLDPPRNTSIPRWTAGKDQTDEVARRFHRLMSTKPPARPSMKDLFGFHAMRTVYARMEKYSPVDHAWWKDHGWLEPGARYFTEDAVIGIKGVLPRLAAWIMGRKMEKIMPRKDPS
jgi:hypothetical protein